MVEGWEKDKKEEGNDNEENSNSEEDKEDDVLGLNEDDEDEEDEEFDKPDTMIKEESKESSESSDNSDNSDNELVSIRDSDVVKSNSVSSFNKEPEKTDEKPEVEPNEVKSESYSGDSYSKSGNPSIPETISSFKGNGDNEDEVFKINRNDFWKFATYVLIAVILIVGFSYFRGGFTGKVVDTNIQAPDVQAGEIARVQVSADDDAFIGDENAPVEIIEFSDFECPFCARFFSQTLDQINTEYIETGKARLVYRDFPLSIHPQAQKAAEAAECAGEQGKFFDMHDKMFENGVSGGVGLFKRYAQEIGLNQDDFDECLDSGKMAEEVQKDFTDGQKAGVSGTPAFFINGQMISGAQPFSVFKQAIDSALG